MVVSYINVFKRSRQNDSVDPDQTAPSVWFVGLHCLPRPVCPKIFFTSFSIFYGNKKGFAISCPIYSNKSYFQILFPSRLTNMSHVHLNGKGNENIWATAWQNQQNDCAQRFLSSMFAWRNLGSCYPLNAQWRLRSDCEDAQTDLRLCWAHRSFCWFCHAVAYFTIVFLHCISVFSSLCEIRTQER